MNIVHNRFARDAAQVCRQCKKFQELLKFVVYRTCSLRRTSTSRYGLARRMVQDCRTSGTIVPGSSLVCPYPRSSMVVVRFVEEQNICPAKRVRCNVGLEEPRPRGTLAMKQKFDELRENLDEFVQQDDYPMLVVGCRPEERANIVKTLQASDAKHPQKYIFDVLGLEHDGKPDNTPNRAKSRSTKERSRRRRARIAPIRIPGIQRLRRHRSK